MSNKFESSGRKRFYQRLHILSVMGSAQSHSNGPRSGGISPNNMPPLLFNNVHGENVTIYNNGSVARRTNSYCKAIAFSDRPVKVNEKVCLKFVEVSTTWSGVLRIGFTSHDPATLRSGLPRYACPDLTQRPGFWAKAFSDYFVKKDSVLFYYTNAAGDVHFGINGEEKGMFFSGVDTRGPLWVMLDIYGNTTCVEFVAPRSHLNNSRRCINNELASSSRVEIESSMSDILPSLSGLKLESSSILDIPCYTDANIEELNFHRVRGRNVMYTADALPRYAIRRASEYCNAYVFTARPIFPDETILIQVMHKDDAYSTSLAFGLTACNPQSISSDSLPDDSHLLLDRPEYWVVKKDIANSPKAKDILAFTVSSTGEVTMSVNGSPPTFQMHVDNSVPLWAFFDLYGTTDRIQCIGTIKSRNTQPHQSQPRREMDQSLLARASKFPSTSAFSQSKLKLPSKSNNQSTPHLPREYFELSHSPNAMKASTSVFSKHSLSAYESLTSGSTQSLKEPSNWSVECVACCEKPVDSVFYSCGHMCMCYECSVEYWKSKEKGCCPICRAVISDVIRTYKS